MINLAPRPSDIPTLPIHLVDTPTQRKHRDSITIAFHHFRDPCYHVPARTSPPVYHKRSYSHLSADFGEGLHELWVLKADLEERFSDTPDERKTVLQHFPDLFVSALHKLAAGCTKDRTIRQEEIGELIELGRSHHQEPTFCCLKKQGIRTVIAGQGLSYILFTKHNMQKDELIGSGTKKRVKFALKTNNGELCAVAVCRKDFLADSDWNLLKHEVRLLERVKKMRGLLQLEAHVEHEGKFYLITEYFNCKDLATLFQNRTQLSRSDKLYIAYQITLGLCNLHLLEIIHRDLNPSNIFISIEEGENGKKKVKAVIGDLGGAGELGKRDVLAHLTGAPAYIAPEKLASFLDSDHKQEEWIATSTPKADIWSMGLILFSLFHPKPGTLLSYQTHKDLEGSIRQLNKEIIAKELEPIDPEIKPILLHMLHIDPSKRARAGIACKQFVELLKNSRIEEEKMPP